ncbi:MAG: nitrate reductase [Pseudomonadota bacterium]
MVASAQRPDWVPTVCPYCGVGCGVLAAACRGGALIKGDPDHPASHGRLCCKGMNLGKTLEPENRLLRPRIEGRDASWDGALDLVACRIREALDRYGPESVAFYVSGQLLTEDYYVANKLMKGFIGAANIDTNSRLCMASAVAAHKRSFGSDTVPGVYEDIEQADLVVLVGSNLAWCHPVLYQRLVAAKTARPQLRVVNIDPRRTATSVAADLQLSLRPGSDLALFNGLLAEIERAGAIDRDYVARHTSGLDEALMAAKAFSLAEVAEKTGLAPSDLERFYALWISTPRVVTLFSQGINQSVSGTDKAGAIINCHLASGRIGQEGMGPFSVTGQPNAMGGREVGGLANTLAAHLDLENPDHRAAVRSFWQAPRIADKPGLKAVDLFHACEAGQIKALWIISTNPVDSMPDADRVRAAIRDCPFVVLSDVLSDTDSARVADVLLPAAAWGEKSGTVTNSERTISRQRAFRAPAGEAKPDWKILCDVAARLGWQEAFAFESPAAVFREHAALSGVAGALGRDFDISDLAEIDDAAYERLQPFRWPRAKAKQGGRFFRGGSFYTQDGRAHIVATPWSSCTADPTAAWPLRLLTGRVRDHWHTMTRSGTAPQLCRRHPEPTAEIHPADAERHQVESGDLVRLTSPLGAVLLRAEVTDATPEGSIFAPIHWSEHYAAQARIDALIPADCDPFSGQPAFKAALVRLARFDPDWWGIAAAVRSLRPGCDYWATARVNSGWAAALAGKDWAEIGLEILGSDRLGSLMTLESGPDSRFLVSVENGKIAALLLVGRHKTRITPAQLANRLGRDLNESDLRLWRKDAEGGPPDPIVCACYTVGAQRIRDAITSQQAKDLDSIGRLLRAGSNCGTCKPEIAALLTETA